MVLRRGKFLIQVYSHPAEQKVNVHKGKISEACNRAWTLE